MKLIFIPLGLVTNIILARTLGPNGFGQYAFIMALIYLGGEAAQVALQMPSAITGVFQGMLLFFLLGSDVFIDNRLRKL